MVVDLKTGNLKLINFGLVNMDIDFGMVIGSGTFCYNAPEIVFDDPLFKYPGDNGKLRLFMLYI
jgi:hypothetical protein